MAQGSKGTEAGEKGTSETDFPSLCGCGCGCGGGVCTGVCYVLYVISLCFPVSVWRDGEMCQMTTRWRYQC